MRESERERERETSMCEGYIDRSVAQPPTGDLAGNPGRCPDQEPNRDLCIHRPGLNLQLFTTSFSVGTSSLEMSLSGPFYVRISSEVY